MKYECHFCDIVYDTYKESADCRKNGHEVLKTLEKKEMKEVEDEVKRNDDFTFEYKERKARVTREVLDHNIQTLRPQTFLQNSGWKMILVYLPTKKGIRIGTGDTESTTWEFLNTAYFVISKPKKSIGKRRKLLPYNDPSLIDKFRITVLSEWNDVRWNISDLKSWLSESELSDPTEIYNLIDQTTRKYLEYNSNPEYVKFNLWNIATYFFELFPVFPYNDFTGTKRAGKTKSLEFQKLVCFNSVMSADITSSATFRMIEGLGSTMLFDETEEFKNKKNEQAQAVRNILIQGFIRDQHAVRNESSKDRNFTPTQFNLYSPKSLAHINAFDDVLEDRCIEQINRRALDLKIRDTWCSERDPSFQKIRNLCYRLFLDYADEIYNLQEEARTLVSISSRELQLWTPLITLALFFEKHGVVGLVDSIKLNISETSEIRQLTDEQESRDLRVLNFIDRTVVPLAQNHEIIGRNPNGWMPIDKMYFELKLRTEEYEINLDYFTRNTLTQTLKKLGFSQKKQTQGISWFITKKSVEDTKKRMGYFESNNETLTSHQGGSETSAEPAKTAESAELGTKC